MAEEAIELKKVARKGATEVQLSGRASLYNAELFEKELNSIVKENKEKTLGFNLAGLQAIDSSGIAALVKVLKSAMGLKIVFFGADSTIQRVFGSTGLDTFFKFTSANQFDSQHPLGGRDDIDDLIDSL